MTTTKAPFRLEPEFNHRIWGMSTLAPWYETAVGEPIGEAWLTAGSCLVATGPDRGKAFAEVTGEFPLLVKMLFPNDKLSIQVHPDDSEAQRMGQPRGKTECWYVLEARPGATVALGLKPGVTLEALRKSAADGTMEALVVTVPVSVGEMIFVDAGTVHAIGAGVVLLEVQQTCDITFRLYDYGRPRELRLEQGLRVTKMKTRAGKVASRPMQGFVRLIEERYFVVDRFEAVGDTVVEFSAPGCLVGLTGSGFVKLGNESVHLLPGVAVICGMGEVAVSGQEVGFVRCVAPE